MSFDIIPHLRATGMTPKDEVIPKRARSVTNLAASFRKLSKADQIELANNVAYLFASGCKAMPEPLKDNVFRALRKGAPSYVPEKNAHRELGGYCLLAATVAVADADAAGGGIVPLAAGILSGVGFLTPLKDRRLEELRRALVQACDDVLYRGSEAVRRRRSIPNERQQKDSPGEDLHAVVDRLVVAFQGSIASLAVNARMDREEIDLLWWAINGRSGVVGQPIEELEAPVAAVAAGLEVAAALAMAPPGDAHRALAERSVPNPDAEHSLLDVVVKSGAYLPRLRSVVASGTATIAGHPRVFPLLFGISHDAGEAGDRLKAEGLDAGRKLSVRAWCHRALEEAALVKAAGHPLVLPAPVRV